MTYGLRVINFKAEGVSQDFLCASEDISLIEQKFLTWVKDKGINITSASWGWLKDGNHGAVAPSNLITDQLFKENYHGTKDDQ
jgi:hypothetical protein